VPSSVVEQTTKSSGHRFGAEASGKAGIVVGCCARATSGHAAAAPPRSVMKSRRPMQAVT
jgi:hypothetical protein